MVGRAGWRRSAVLTGGIALTATVLFAVAAPQSVAQSGSGLMGRVRNGIRLLSGSGQPGLPTRPVTIEAKSARVLEREADERMRDPNLLQWGQTPFDPLKGIALPQGIPAELASPSRSLPQALAQSPDDVDYWIVQYDRDIARVKKAIENAGAEIVAVVPNYAYLVRADGVQLRQIQVDPVVRWTGRNLPAWKLDAPTLAMLSAGGDPTALPLDPQGLVRISARLQPGIPPDVFAAYYDAVKQIPGAAVLDADPMTDAWVGQRFLLGVDPASVESALVTLASFRDVATVESAELPRPANDQAVWFVQGGNDQIQASDYNISAPLFANGLTGRGLIGGVCDTGLENDLCFFRYSNAKNDVGWVLGYSASRGGGGSAAVPDEGSLDLTAVTPAMRTRDRKVVAYYVQDGGAAAYSDVDQHGTGVAGSMAADAYSVLAARPLVRDLGERQNVRFWFTGGTWAPGQELRPDIASRVDDPLAADAGFPSTYGNKVQHHQAKDGMAPGAQIVFQDIGTPAGGIQFSPTMRSIYEQASRTGVTAHNSSFGGPACSDCYSGDAVDADNVMFYRRDLLAFVAAGNLGVDGARTIGRGMAHAKSTVVAGWSIHANSPSCGFCPNGNTPRLGQGLELESSRGPSSGGMIAPTVVFPGTVTTVASRNDPQVNPEDGTGASDGGCGNPSGPAVVGGTSFASPVGTGAALLVQQYFYDGYYPSGRATPGDALRPTNALVKAVLVNSARNMEGARTDETGTTQADRPNNGQGWGGPRLDDTLYFLNDPKLGNPEFETERARFAVLNDVPNGFEGDPTTLSFEPGGKRRNEIVNNFKSALALNGIHTFQIDVVNDLDGDTVPDPDALANELRFTLAWSDVPGSAAQPAAPQVNDLDLEVVSPGPNGALETPISGPLGGDDIVYRTRPIAGVWTGGYTQPSPDLDITTTANIGTPFNDSDNKNTVENVFIAPQDVYAGTYQVRVIARTIRGVGGTNQGYPNYVAGDTPLTRDTDGDAVPDQDEFDVVRGDLQGYALIASGNFTTDQGSIAMNKSAFGCIGEELSLSLNDKNGGSADPGCTNVLSATLRTTVPGPSFPADFENVEFTGAQPSYQSVNPVTGGRSFPVVLVRDPSDVVNGDGIIQVAHGETILAEYQDNAPCGGAAFAQAIISCQPAIQDQGFQIADGCDFADPGNPANGARPDQFMDRGELNRYQVFVANTGGEDMTDAVISLYPDPNDVNADKVTVLDSPRYIGLMPPGRIADATFLVQVEDTMPSQYQMDFIVEVTSPRDGLLFPASFRQTQTLEADIVSYRYDTRDPNGELYKRGRIEKLKAGVEVIPAGNPDSDYITNEPMWWDPDTNVAADCDIPRNLWPDPFTTPARCNPNLNPTNPWDFDDTDDQFVEAAHDGDTALGIGVDFPAMWYWKAAPNGGGCGWEDELHRQLATGTDPLPAGHPDRVAQPWGIWHTGQINQGAGTQGPFAGDATDSQGVAFMDAPGNINDHTIMWNGDPATSADNNSAGEWCNTYLSDPNIAVDIYRSMLLAPTLYRVHSDPLYRVEFQEFTWYSRLDAHTRSPVNLAALGWFVNNQPVTPTNLNPLSTTWDSYQYYTNIYSDKVREFWDVDDNTLGDNLSHPNEDFPYLTYEDIFGPAADSWSVAFGWSHIHQDGARSRGQYGAGIDDVSFVWTESRDDIDRSDCSQLPNGQRPIIWFGENRYNACEGTLRINLWAPAAPTTRPIAVAVTSAAEDFETAILRYNATLGRFQGDMEFTSDSRNDAVGVLLVSAGAIDIGNGADPIRVEYDPETVDYGGDGFLDSDPAATPEARADWKDLNGNGINDDADGDGVPDVEDDQLPARPASEREVRDFATINCTSGRLFYIKHELQQVGAGDGDRFADPGETQRMKVYLVSSIGADLEDVEVRISSDDPVSISTDTVTMASLPGNGTVVDTGFGFEFCVPLGMQTTDIANPRTITFRIDVRGRNVTNLNEFSTAGESFNSFLPLEAWLLADVDAVPTNADYVDVVQAPVPPTGTFFEGFDGTAGSDGFDHQFANGFQPGFQTIRQSTTTDVRFGMAGNSGFCPECDVQDDCSVTAGNCQYYFNDVSVNPAFDPGYNPSDDPPWNWTDEWAHGGSGSYKFGQLNAGPTQDDQHYPKGVYASLQFPPLRLSSTYSQPELSWWQIVNLWGPFFTNGLFTPIDGCIVEIAPSAIGVGDSGGPSADDLQRSNRTLIAQRYPLSNFRRLSPYEGLYDWETDALNACRALFCRYKHPVFAFQGSPTQAPASPRDPEAGTVGQATWKFSRIDLSDFRGMEVVIQFSAEVLQDLDIQNGSIGWFVDEVQLTGVSKRIAMRRQDTNLTTEPCGIVADFAASEPACFGSDMQFFDRHSGVGAFDTSVNPSVPFPIEYEWIIPGMPNLRGFAGALVPSTFTGVFGTYDNPRINLQSAAGIASPGVVRVQLNLYQNALPAGTITHDVVYKDAPVPIMDAVATAFVGGNTQFNASASFLPTLDPTRTLYWEWTFGDGTGADSSGPSVQHVFERAGTYTVTLKVYDEEGCAGTITQNVTVTASPFFRSPVIAAAADPDCGAPFGGDNNADIEELISVDIRFANAPLPNSARATGVVGYLSSPDPFVDIVTGVADFGDVDPGTNSSSMRFRFIRRDDGVRPAPSCMVLPFQLTLVGNGGAVEQVLDLSFTMGTGTQATFDNTGTQTGNFARNAAGDASATTSYTAPAGCLTGLELDMDVSSTAALVSDLKVEIFSPDSDAVAVLYPNGAPGDQGPYTIHFRFGADNGGGPIPDLGGQLEQVPPTVLDPTVAANLVSQLTGKSMLGTWQVKVSSNRPGSPTSTYSYTIREFRLEGTNSGNLDIGNPIGCGDACLSGGSAPVFGGATAGCPGLVYFQPASDTYSCDGTSDVTYELWASTVAGQLGRRVDGTANEVTSCGACTDPDGACALQNPPDATFWNVCETETVFWTVIAVDGSGQRTPNIGAVSPSTEPTGAYQTVAKNCDLPITPGVFSIIKSNATTATAWLVPPTLHPTWPLFPPANATEYRILRGTFPTAGGRLAVLGTRAGVYDHVARPGDCSFPTTTRDISSDLSLAGSYYYLVPGVNSGGCGGMGQDSDGNDIPGTGTGCPTNPDCFR